MKFKISLIILSFFHFIGNSQTIYMSGPGLTGETTTGKHANEVPLEAFEMDWTNSSNTLGEIDFKIKKRINKSSPELFERNTKSNTSLSNDYTIRFYDDQDVNYYTLQFTGVRIDDGSRSSIINNKFYSPTCDNGNCSNHFEEFNFELSVCSNCSGTFTIIHELTGETKNYP